MVEPAHRFAQTRPESRLRRWTRALAILSGRPSEAAEILRARLSGKRVRARQALASLLGLDHHGLWCRPGMLGYPSLAGTPPETRLPPGIAVVSERRSAQDLLRSVSSPLLILCPPGHHLMPGAAAAIQAAFEREPQRQAIYADAFLLRADGAAMPLLRPAFDPDYLLAVDYVGPVAALRRSGLEALVARTEAGGGAAELILRLATLFGPGAIGHLPRPLSWARLDDARGEPAGEGGQGGHRAIAQAVLAHAISRPAGVPEAEAEIDGIVCLRWPLPAEPPLVSLIVPTRDRLDLLRPCIASLLDRTDWPAREILICDNDSREPETLAYLADLAARGLARIVSCPGPFNFAGMNNAAARAAHGGVLAFINNDVAAIRGDWLERLLREALRPEVGAVGAKLIDGAGRIQHGGVLLGPGGLVTHAHRFFSGDAPGYLAGLRATRAVPAVTAACLVVEARKFAAVGGFDAETFAIDFNDVDLCLRLGRAGYRTLLVPGAVLDHVEGASRRRTPEAEARHRREVAAFRTRWGPLLVQGPHYHPGFDPDLGTYARLRPGWPGAAPVRTR